MRRFVIIGLLMTASVLLTLGGSPAAGELGKPPRPAAIRWLTPQALADSMRAQPRPVLVKIGTAWCRYCRLQDATAFRNPAVVARLNTDFYAIALDAESRMPLPWAGHIYTFQPTGPGAGVHGLALALGRDSATAAPVYPTTVLLDTALRVQRRWAGLLSADALLPALAPAAPAAKPRGATGQKQLIRN